jgi:orotidine-5'-phosphate decarboxylase
MDKLIEKIAQMQNPTVAGLDPAWDLIPPCIKKTAIAEHGETLEAAAAAVIAFNHGLIDALHDIVPAVKPQLAFYEALGVSGIYAFYKTVEYAKQNGMYVIADAKRGDIGSTAEGYASAFLGSVKIGESEHSPFRSDALTVNAYLGSDGVLPFVKICKENNSGIFVLVKTSNPSSGELQDKQIDGKAVYELMGEMVADWGKDCVGKYGYSAVGAVVGATYPEQIAELRGKLINTFFLIPGYGAQGASAKDVAAAFDKNGVGGIVNSSRGIIAAYKKDDSNGYNFAEAARNEAIRMRDELMSEIGEVRINAE